ncbi:MAG: hypothetical protein U0R50_13335 [Gaiellales bacterium]
MYARLGLALVLGVATAIVSQASASSTRTTFADGTWTAVGRITGGIFGDVNMEGTGTVRFHMTICHGHALGGQLTFSERFHGAVRGQRFTGTANGTLRIRATERDAIHVRGPVRVTATVLGITTGATATGDGRITGSGTARRMTGDLAIDARAIQSASSAIGSTTVEAPYVARRTGRASC